MEPNATDQTNTQFYCHGCHTNTIPNRNGEEMMCSVCGSEFIEEVEPSDPPTQFEAHNNGQASSTTTSQPYVQPATPTQTPMQLIPPIATQLPIPQTMHAIMSQLFQRMIPPGGQANQPQIFFQNINLPPMPFVDMVTMIQGGNGGNIFNMGGPMVGNPGDYYMGGNMEQLLNQLFQNAHHNGPPPASTTAISQLKRGTIESTETKGECAICKDEFEAGVECIEMPCVHIFHPDCLLAWLQIHNSCPVCRMELKTDDPDYEARRTRTSNP